MDSKTFQLKLKIIWRGSGIKEKGYVNGKLYVSIDKRYFRPTEVESLLGKSSLARKELNWKPTVDIKSLVKEMIANEFNLIEKK